MAPKCYICNYYNPRKMSLFRVPDRNDEYSERGGLWLKLLEEKSENIHKIRICSEHFLQKKPAKSGDHLDLDWIPNKNLGRFSKNWKLIEYHFRKKNSPVQCLNSLETNEKYLVQRKSTNSNLAITNQNARINCSNVVIDPPNECSSIDERSNEMIVYSNEPTADANVDRNNGAINDESNVIAQSAIERYSERLVENVINPGPSTVAATMQGNNWVEPGVNGKMEWLIPEKKRKIQIIEQKFFFPKAIQTELLSSEIDLLFKYYQDVKEERDALLTKISSMVIDTDYFKGNDKKTRFYTGLPTWSLLNDFFEMVEYSLPTHSNCKLSPFQMLVLTLIKLRLNLKFTDLGYRFQISESAVSRYFHRCLYILFKLFEKSKLVHWPERKNLLMNVPSYFRSTFKEAITIIVDCFEIFIERSSVLRAAAQAFSQYKHHATLKYLIGIATTGAIIFISPGYGGRASDKEVVKKSGFLEKLEEGDFVLADKGFLIEDEVEAKKASLKIPSFVSNGNQLHPTEVEQSRQYSSIRIHVERLIAVLREKFNICSDIAQMSAVSKQNDMFNNDLYDKIVYVCCCLVNICPPAVNNDFEM